MFVFGGRYGILTFWFRLERLERSARFARFARLAHVARRATPRAPRAPRGARTLRTPRMLERGRASIIVRRVRRWDSDY